MNFVFLKSLVIDILFCFGFQFPIGIDSERFIRALEVPEVIQHMKELKERFAGRKVHAFLSLIFLRSMKEPTYHVKSSYVAICSKAVLRQVNESIT